MTNAKAAVHGEYPDPIIDVTDPQNGLGTNVLYSNGKFMISCQGYVQHAGSDFATVWGRVYTDRHPEFLTTPPPFAPHLPAQTAYIPSNNKTLFYFYGEPHLTSCYLIPLADDPTVTTTQYLYVWGQRASDGKYADPCEVILDDMVVAAQTNSGDTQC